MEQFGHKFGIQYNPNKTVHMVFNRLIKRSVTDKMEDQWHGPSHLCNKP